jgi:hypothetical protein
MLISDIRGKSMHVTDISRHHFSKIARRVAKHWQGGDKCLAAIHLAQMGLRTSARTPPIAWRWRPS